MVPKIVRITLSETLKNFEELIMLDESTLYEITSATKEECETLKKRLYTTFDVTPLYGCSHKYLELYCAKNGKISIVLKFDFHILESDVVEFLKEL